MSSFRVGFCVSGRGALFRAAVLNRDAALIDPALLILETKSAPDLEAFALAAGIPCVRLDPRDRDAFARDLHARLADAGLDLVSLTFDRIVARETVTAWDHRMINVHPSLLPAFPGNRGMEQALAAGARLGGATIHEVAWEVDAGAIIAQAVVPIEPDDSVASYGGRIYRQLEPMYLQVLRWYAEGRVGRSASGRIIVKGARYDSLPIVPALEAFRSES